LEKTRVRNFEIDTSNTSDAGLETAVKKDSGNWIPVEWYDGIRAAINGHEKWVKTIQEKPDFVIVDPCDAMRYELELVD